MLLRWPWVLTSTWPCSKTRLTGPPRLRWQCWLKPDNHPDQLTSNVTVPQHWACFGLIDQFEAKLGRFCKNASLIDGFLLTRSDESWAHILQGAQWVGLGLCVVDTGLPAPGAVDNHVIDQQDQGIEAPASRFRAT